MEFAQNQIDGNIVRKNLHYVKHLDMYLHSGGPHCFTETRKTQL